MIAKLLDAVFGCRHARYSFPITSKPLNRAAGAPSKATYVVCLDCGREFPYDWKQMKIVPKEGRQSGAVASLATKEAA